jgi:hypothetical protein
MRGSQFLVQTKPYLPDFWAICGLWTRPGQSEDCGPVMCHFKTDHPTETVKSSSQLIL